jgi:hypothetical protein
MPAMLDRFDEKTRGGTFKFRSDALAFPTRWFYRLRPWIRNLADGAGMAGIIVITPTVALVVAGYSDE